MTTLWRTRHQQQLWETSSGGFFCQEFNVYISIRAMLMQILPRFQGNKIFKKTWIKFLPDSRKHCNGGPGWYCNSRKVTTWPYRASLRTNQGLLIKFSFQHCTLCKVKTEKMEAEFFSPFKYQCLFHFFLQYKNDNFGFTNFVTVPIR